MTDGVLFICLGNSCRSIMAEALARQLFPDPLKVGSAGIRPLGFIPDETLEVLVESGIATDGLWSKGLADVDLANFPLLVNLTDYPWEGIIPADFQGRLIEHPVIDPFGHPLAIYRQALEAVRRFISQELPPLLFTNFTN
jgi:protein-tyrosine-phosphatase|uniref:Low molecular weight phosphatase family protein n=1 Tax=Desulfobacca acetoxidans TaxID=60893 RepID=A0A7C3Z3V2_9BACT